MSALKAAVYARLSLSTEESVSIARQLESCRQYAEQQGYEVVAEAVDESVSATRFAPDKRPGFVRLLERADELDLVVVWKVDRLARRTLDFLRTYEQLQAHGCTLAAVQDHLDLSTAQGRAFATVLAVFGEMEAASISARTKAARDYLLRAGRAVGNPPWFIRSAPDPDGAGRVWRLVPERAAAIREAYTGMLVGRYTLRELCRRWDAEPALRARRGSWTPSGVRRLLRSPVLYGATLAAGEPLRGPDGLVLIDESREVLSFAEWVKLQQVLDNRAVTPQRRGDLALLSGVLQCHACGEYLHPNRNGKVPRYLCGTSGCRAPVAVSMRAVERYVSDVFLDEYADRPVMVADTAPAGAEVAQLREAVTALTLQLTTATEATLLDVFRQRADLQQRLEAVETTPGPVALRASGETYGDRWVRGDDADRNALLRNAYAAVVVFPGVRGERFNGGRLRVIQSDLID